MVPYSTVQYRTVLHSYESNVQGQISTPRGVVVFFSCLVAWNADLAGKVQYQLSAKRRDATPRHGTQRHAAVRLVQRRQPTRYHTVLYCTVQYDIVLCCTAQNGSLPEMQFDCDLMMQGEIQPHEPRLITYSTVQESTVHPEQAGRRAGAYQRQRHTMGLGHKLFPSQVWRPSTRFQAAHRLGWTGLV